MTIQPIENYRMSAEETKRLCAEYSKHYLYHGVRHKNNYCVLATKATGKAGHALLGLSIAWHGVPITQDSLLQSMKAHEKDAAFAVVPVSLLLEFLHSTSSTEGYTVPPALFAFLEADTNKLRSVCWDGSSWYAGLVEV